LLAAAVLVVVIITALRFTEGRKPQSAGAEMAASRVAVQKVAARDTPVVIRGCGVVAPCVEVDLMPEVAGRVTFVHSELKRGGVIRAGEKIIRIDPREYELVVQQAQAAVAEAQAHLDLRTTEADVMRQLNPEEPNSPRIFGEPQVLEAWRPSNPHGYD
jgi:multidrug efflux pump subunit AcrA (membrane-fusion protein)